MDDAQKRENESVLLVSTEKVTRWCKNEKKCVGIKNVHMNQAK